MYDWSFIEARRSNYFRMFQLLLKGCTIEALAAVYARHYSRGFSCCWKDVRLKPIVTMQMKKLWTGFSCCWKDVRLKLQDTLVNTPRSWCFSCCWKDVRLKHNNGKRVFFSTVSVVVERMYDWSSETNWLKTNDFWQLVSDLFFENGRSAQKVPLFSKIWGDLGDCLTVFDSCSNI